MKHDFLDLDRNAKALCRAVGFFGGGFVGYRVAMDGIGATVNFWGDWVAWLAASQGVVVGALLGLVSGQILYFVYRRLRG
jgi:hypothetical protein